MKTERPAWLNKKIDFRAMHGTELLLRGLDLHTVCHQARCPNISECFGRGTATFLILGDVCTRGCAFCGVRRGTPAPVDEGEPARVAEAVRRMGLRHAVVTSVTRDDLADGGAGLFARTAGAIKEIDASITVEVLVPDFMGDEGAIRTVASAGPDIFGHNIETVPSLYGVRKKCDYDRSLRVITVAKEHSPGTRTKSALLVGLGERGDEVVRALHDLRAAGCDYVSIGQYLQPGRHSAPVREYIRPGRFNEYRTIALDIGFVHVESGPYVRSSYMADRYR
ncbi:MAG: lipoyl synthase [Spirochaetes bacterium RBG_13_51_14]|nr:MAG: lipoyl synthase [Spirochaetes bacterium RBG_13_51_14]